MVVATDHLVVNQLQLIRWLQTVQWTLCDQFVIVLSRDYGLRRGLLGLDDLFYGGLRLHHLVLVISPHILLNYLLPLRHLADHSAFFLIFPEWIPFYFLILVPTLFEKLIRVSFLFRLYLLIFVAGWIILIFLGPFRIARRVRLLLENVVLFKLLLHFDHLRTVIGSQTWNLGVSSRLRKLGPQKVRLEKIFVL